MACDRIPRMEKKIERIRNGRCNLPGARGISGDTALFTHLPDGSMAFILSDGMGKGFKAAEESRLVAERLRKLLREGVSAATAIKAVNKAMLESKRGGYTFATVDMTIIELANRRARFYKMGAATSFLVRDNSVRRVEHPALPVGILSRLKLRAVSVEIRPGDIIVMVSDGITEADRGDLSAVWLQTALCNIPEYMGHVNLAEAIAQLAFAKYGRREKDDLTVMVMMIE